MGLLPIKEKVGLKKIVFVWAGWLANDSSLSLTSCAHA
jgi:hypothetical protein